MIDITKPVFFYDDRGRNDILMEIDKVLFHNEIHVLCTVKEAVCYDDEEAKEAVCYDDEEAILFLIDSGKVLNSNYDSWYAQNDDKFIQELREKFIEREKERKEDIIAEIHRLSSSTSDGKARSSPILEKMSIVELLSIRDSLKTLVDEGKKILDNMTPEKLVGFFRLFNEPIDITILDTLKKIQTKYDQSGNMKQND
jgi:hypothetical protein